MRELGRPRCALRAAAAFPPNAKPHSASASLQRVVRRAYTAVKSGSRSYNSLGATDHSLGAAEQKHDLVGGTLMEAAGEPGQSFETCSPNSDLLAETAPRPPGPKGSMGLVATACSCQVEAAEEIADPV